MAANRTWLWVILGIFGAIVLCVVVVIGGAIFEFRSHVKNEVVASTVAEEEFARQRERFHGQQPLIEFADGTDDRDDRPTIHHPPADAHRVEIHTLRVLVYDLNQGHLIHADIPGWLLRMMPDGQRRTGMYGPGFDMSRNNISIEEIERHGYGLIMDGRNRNSRILVWSE